MKAKLIKNDADHQEALKRIDEIFNARPGTPEGNELELLVHLVEEYEESAHPIPLPDPVEAIRFRMEQEGLKQADLVPYLGTRSRVSEVLSGRRKLTLAMIRRLHKGLGIPAEVLLQEPGQALSYVYAGVDWNKFPLAEMLKRKWFSGFAGRKKDLCDQAEEILGPLLFPGGQDCRELSMAARQSIRPGSAQDDHALWAWQSRVLQLSRNQEVGDYDPKAMTRDFMKTVLSLSRLDDGPLQAQRLLTENGIATVMLHHLPGTHLDGAAMLRPDGHPVIALALRYDRLDNFWFTLAHELAHVVLHLAKGDNTIFLDDLETEPGSNLKEEEADNCAAEILVPSEDLKNSGALESPTPELICEVALRNHVHPAVVAGRVRYMRKDYKLLSKLIGNRAVRKLFLDYKMGDAA